jgi:hypothetical protein
MFSIEALIQIVIYLIVFGLVAWLLLWLVDYVGLPEPFNKVAKVIVAVVCVLVVISVLLGFVSGRPVFIR